MQSIEWPEIRAVLIGYGPERQAQPAGVLPNWPVTSIKDMHVDTATGFPGHRRGMVLWQLAGRGVEIHGSVLDLANCSGFSS